MATAKKTTNETVESIVTENEQSAEITPEEIPATEEPAIEEKPKPTKKDKAVEEAAVIPESSEILFLRHLMNIQHSGGWGKHLDHVINERIKELQA